MGKHISKRFSLSLPAKLAERVDAETKASGLKASEIIRVALDHYLREDNHGKKY